MSVATNTESTIAKIDILYWCIHKCMFFVYANCREAIRSFMHERAKHDKICVKNENPITGRHYI